MMMNLLVRVLEMILLSEMVVTQSFHTPGPEQIHISLGNSSTDMSVHWSTPDQDIYRTSYVHYGLAPENFSSTEEGECVKFSIGNPKGLQLLHRVILKGLIPGRRYSYRVESGGLESKAYEFVNPRDDLDFSPRFLVYGDMGQQGGAPILSSLIDEAKDERTTAVLHVGDFAYDMHSDGGLVGDAFMRRIEPIAARLPYMTAPGNHEIAFEFSNYRHRFSSPQLPWPSSVDRLWYSFNMGRAHIISYSTEVYFTNGPINDQYAWLNNDLAEANKPENRAQRPWIITFGHRPMYCSNNDRDDCTRGTSVVRQHLEELFFKHGVDLIIEAHEHSYERLWPTYDGVVTQSNYDNPLAPVHIISGAAGCAETIDPIIGPRGSWSAFRAAIQGVHSYGRLDIVNKTHVYWEQIVGPSLIVEDSFWIKQEKHGPFETAAFPPKTCST